MRRNNRITVSRTHPAAILACIFTLIVCLVLPVVLLLLLVLKYKKEKIFPAWLLGAAGFFVTQMLIRVPILTVLQGQRWFMEFANSHLFLYAFGLAFTAGLFELAENNVRCRCELLFS